LDLNGLLRSLTGLNQGYALEMRVDNLQMDMTSMEMLVANAHQQIQCVEEETKEEFHKMKDDFYDRELKQYLWGGILTDKVDTMKERMDWMEEQFGNLLHFINSGEDAEELFRETINTQATTILSMDTTILTLKDWVGELELGRRLLCDRIIAIEVGGQEPLFDL
jgi:predicted  nucleic acid-binding Zn-ribbon protein